MNIYIPIEVKARELEGKVLVALVAAERGHSVVLGGKEDTLGLARSGLLKPGIVHDTALTPSTGQVEALRDLVRNGHVITSQDEEHGLLDESYDTFARVRFSAETNSMASGILCWGAHDAGALRNLYGFGNGNAIVETGSPRVDFWRREFAPYYAAYHERLMARLGDFVLVSSNFGTLLNVRRFWELLRLRRESNQLVDTESEYEMYREAGWLMGLLSEYVRMIRVLASTQTGIRVVVRPHPTETEDAWRMLIGDCPNAVVTSEGTLSTWIRGAKALVHNGCTSGFEAAVSGVPRIAYMPVRSTYERTVPNRVSYRAGSLDELLAAVQAVLDGGSLENRAPGSGDVAAILRDRFANLDGPLAADRIVDEWQRLASGSLEGTNDWASVRRACLKRRIRRRISRVVYGTRRTKTGRSPSITSHKFPDISDSEMRTIITNLRSSLGRFQNVTHDRIGERSFVFRSA